MYCDYKINQINDLGNEVEVNWTIYEGNYQGVEENGELVNRYVRLGVIQTGTDWFEKSPVYREEMAQKLKEAIQLVKGGRDVIPECL